MREHLAMTEPVSRASLYDAVWGEPMSKLAPRLGFSDRGLAKICVSNHIPVPPRGYWARLAHGHKVTRPPLPPISKGDEPRIYLQQRKAPAPTTEAPSQQSEIAFEQQPENRVVVPQRLGRVHPLVDKTRTILKSCRPTRWSRGLVWARECLDVKVAPASLPRAMRIMQALLDALEKRGHTVAISKTERPGLAVSMLGEQVMIHLVERTTKPLRSDGAVPAASETEC
jgi:hypothetical protein